MLIQHMNNTLRRISALSFLAIIMVVFIHSSDFHFKDGMLLPTQDQPIKTFIQFFISQGIARAAVPIFFCISGYLFFAKFEPKVSFFLNQLRKRISSLFFPYLIWSGGFIVLFFVLLQIPTINASVNDAANRVVDYSFQNLLERLLVRPIPFQLWFVRDLIIFSVLSPVIWFCIRTIGVSFLIILFILGFLGFSYSVGGTFALFYFSLGSYLALKPIGISETRLSKPVCLLLIGLWIGLIVLRGILFLEYGESYFKLDVLSNLFGLAGLWVGYRFLSEAVITLLIKLSPYTFFIFAAHEPFMSMVVLKGLRFLLSDTWQGRLAMYFLGPIITIPLLVIVGMILRRYFPFVFGALTGGRGIKRV